MLLLLLACDPGPAVQPGAVLLARHPELLVSLTLPETSRQGLPPLHGQQPLECEAWKETRREGDLVEWSCPLPTRTVNYWHDSTRQPPGLRLWRDIWPLHFLEKGQAIGARGSFSHKNGRVFVPWSEEPEKLSFVYPQAREEERALNLDTAALEDTDFALRSLPMRHAFRHGLFLPAPAEAVFEVEVPADGHLRMGALLLKPALQQTASSDGATLLIELEEGGLTTPLEELELSPHNGDTPNLDLSRWEGKTVRLHLRTEAGDSALLDYVFLTEPTLYSPKKDPRRVAFVFIDTLRRDHLGAYGYERPVSPNLDRLASQGMVYDQARAPAPWTLPSGRASVTGKHPEDFVAGEHLGTVFAEQGWATAAVVGNTYLSRNFDLATGWSLHRGEVSTNASEATNLALEVLGNHEDRDLALFVHYMDPHLPYTEPGIHRLWAGEPPVPLGHVWMEKDLGKAWEEHPLERDAMRQHVIDRYDQNIHYVDGELRRLLEALGPEATVVVFSDHGEEFWERGVVGHGHGLSEELLRVPLILRGPGVEPARSSRPATLQDILPTVLEVVGLEVPEQLAGTNLLGPEDPQRPIAIGSPLFSESALGVVHQGHKWILKGLDEHLYDLEADPSQASDLAGQTDLGPYRAAYEQALGRPLRRVLRLVAEDSSKAYLNPQERLLLWVPGGIVRVWPRPGGSFRFKMPVPDGERVEVRGRARPSELFVLPTDPQVEPVVESETGSFAWTLRPEGGPPDERQLSDTLKRELEALGYVE